MKGYGGERLRFFLRGVIDEIRRQGIREIYPSFDAVPLPNKSDSLFVVAGLDKVQTDFPFPDGKGGIKPFSADVRVSILIPMTAPVSRAEECFYEKICPAMQKVGAALCETAAPLTDVKLQRVVMYGIFRFRGLCTESLAEEDEV